VRESDKKMDAMIHDFAQLQNIVFKNIKLRTKKYFHKVLACSGDVYYYITKSPKHHGDELKTETLDRRRS
jgi:predicted methyltransferase